MQVHWACRQGGRAASKGGPARSPASASWRAPLACVMTRTPSASVKGRSSGCSGRAPPPPPKLTTPSSPTCRQQLAGEALAVLKTTVGSAVATPHASCPFLADGQGRATRLGGPTKGERREEGEGSGRSGVCGRGAF